MKHRKYPDLREIKDLLSLPWESLNRELELYTKEDMKSVIAYASGFYQAHKE